MRIAVAATGENLEAAASPVFGRCSHFIFVDVAEDEIKNIKAINNPAMMAGGGAGIQAAQLIAEEKADVLVSGAIGPNAFDILEKFAIKIYKIKQGSVNDNINYFKAEELEQITSPLREGRGRGGRGGGQRINR